jgi:hypothetical protein
MILVGRNLYRYRDILCMEFIKGLFELYAIIFQKK